MNSRMGDSSDSDRSVIRECYWVLCGQFTSSDEPEDDPEDQIKSGFIAVAIATSVLAFAAGTSSLLASNQNWPTAAVLFVVGIGVLVFAWFVGLHRLDDVIIST